MAERSKHIISSFDAALDVLKNDILMMSSLTDQNFHSAIEALLNRNSELCNQVISLGFDRKNQRFYPPIA